MQQRQLRLGDVLDDYCPRERRLTNHAVVAMVGDEVRLTRCTTCEAEHDYKHARLPRQRRKPDGPAALFAQAAGVAPKRVVHEPVAPTADLPDVGESMADGEGGDAGPSSADFDQTLVAGGDASGPDERGEPGEGDAPENEPGDEMDGPVHRRLIRAALPKIDGHVPPPRQAPDFTIRQPAGGRVNRFRPRQARGGPSFSGTGANGNGAGPMRSGGRPPAGRPGMPSGRPSNRRGPGRGRSK